MTLRTFGCQLRLEGFDGSLLDVTAFSAAEALDVGHEVVVEATTDAPFDPSELIGQTASVVLFLDEDMTLERPFHGYLFDAHIKSIRDDLYQVRFVIRARLELLGIGRNSRIFQEQNVPDIVSAILDEAGLADAYQWSLVGSYKPRPYVVQYSESDLQFITRLLADEGIGFAVRNEEDADKVEFFDDSTRHPTVEDEDVLLDARATMLDVNVVSDSSDVHSARSDATMLRDYDFTQPSTDLSADADGQESAGRQVYIHPGNFFESNEGKARVNWTLESLQQRSRVLEAVSDCPRFEPGRIFSLHQHAHVGTDGDFMIVSVTHRIQFHSEGDRAITYSNLFTALPSDVHYRPEVSMERPHPGGIQNAFVTVPSGGEIHSNENGCVKVRFPWDRSGVTDDKSSTWLRVGQYPLGGSMTIPRGGFEVLVDYELGDINRPCVVGHLYNGAHRPPYALPDNAVRSSFKRRPQTVAAGRTRFVSTTALAAKRSS